MILKAQMQTVGGQDSNWRPSLVRLGPVRATNYVRWCRLWLQSNRFVTLHTRRY